MTRVLVGMSGGVDSSVAAYLLQKEGYEVVGVTMNLLDKANETTINDAKLVCEKLNIEHYIVDYKDFFKDTIIRNFIDSYQKAETPNPCILCNKKLKFGLLWEKAQELNCDYIATGHYAKIENNHIYRIDSDKDQSYFLYQINKDIISHILFPLSNYPNKEEIRKIAESLGLVTAHKKDSQDICFIENNKYTDFLENNMEYLPSKGNFILDGKVIGEHKGLIYYTIGQRKGLGISYQEPLYVISLDKENNNIYLGREDELYTNIVNVTSTNFLVDEIPTTCQAKIRYKSKLSECTIKIIDDNNMEVIFKEPVKSATPGQSLVLYNDNLLIGGGIIKN